MLTAEVSPLPSGQTSKNSFWPRRSDVPPTLNYFCPSEQYKLKNRNNQQIIGSSNWNCKNSWYNFCLPVQQWGATIIQKISSGGPEFWNAPVRHVSLQCFCLHSNWCQVPPAQILTRSSPNWRFGIDLTTGLHRQIYIFTCKKQTSPNIWVLSQSSETHSAPFAQTLNCNGRV